MRLPSWLLATALISMALLNLTQLSRKHVGGGAGAGAVHRYDTAMLPQPAANDPGQQVTAVAFSTHARARRTCGMVRVYRI